MHCINFCFFLIIYFLGSWAWWYVIDTYRKRLYRKYRLFNGFFKIEIWSLKFNHLQDHLGEVVFVELPEPGGSVSQGSSFGAVESVKATSDINSPISGEVVEVNSKLTESPGLVILSLYFTYFILHDLFIFDC